MALASAGLGLAVRSLMQEATGEHPAHEAHAAEECFCLAEASLGTDTERVFCTAILWVAFALSLVILLFYAYRTWQGTCGWEEVYVVTIEMLKTIMEIFFEHTTPATISQINGIQISWLRYAEWLLTCPVILIHLSNLTGLNQYSKRTMRLLVSDIGTIVCGVSAALSPSPAKIVFFIFGLCYGASTFITAAGVYVQAFKDVPEGKCKLLVKFLAWVFFGSWVMFPLLFLMGPEGFGHLSPSGSVIAHTFADLLSKNLWGLLAHFLRVEILHHVIAGGSVGTISHIPAELAKESVLNRLSAPTKLAKRSIQGPSPRETVAAATAAAEGRVLATIGISSRDGLRQGMYSSSGAADGSPTKSAATLGYGRQASFGRHDVGGYDAGVRRTSGLGWGDPAAQAGDAVQVLLTLPAQDSDLLLDRFKDELAALPFPAMASTVVVTPAALLSAAANAVVAGGADVVMLHPNFLREGGATLLGTLKEMGHHVCLYGCDSMGPPDDLEEFVSMLDGWVEGPTINGPVNNRQLSALLLTMQAARKAAGAALQTASVGGFGRSISPRNINLSPADAGNLGRSFSGSFTNMGGRPGAAPAQPATYSGAATSRRSFDANRSPTPRPISPLTATGAMSPAANAPGRAPGAPAASAAGVASAAGLNLSEAEILQQLMGEISRLKKEFNTTDGQ